MSTAIEFNNISKLYRLGLVSSGTLSHDLKRWWMMNIKGEEDPYLKIGSVNDRSKAADSEYVWALKDIDFKVEQGDVVGIIGKNGAGKSTLLKILSKITAPTTGTIKAKGRIGSLLEVGTGFHPEMTGRENIYLNGAILGMTKPEITRKLDEIVDFSGCERYIDTPVKRYSSGMMVRLGFVVAAHLDPEILVVDEVLAVGDAEFQKKAIGKMQDVSRGEGRTVLFVSHNMASIKNLCRTGILLENGMVKSKGKIDDIVEMYCQDNKVEIGNIYEQKDFYRPVNTARNLEIKYLRRLSSYVIDGAETIVYIVGIENKLGIDRFQITTMIDDISDLQRAGMIVSDVIEWKKGCDYMEFEVSIDNHHLSKGRYVLDVWAHSGNIYSSYSLYDAVYRTLTFEVDSFEKRFINEWHNYWGKLYYKSRVQIVKGISKNT